MNFIKNCPYDRNILYEDGFNWQGLKQRLFFQKSIMKMNGKTQYFLKSYINGKNVDCQGYIYFYLNQDLKVSDFIGVYVKPEYRNTGVASFLVASWIQFCFNNGYDFLGTNKKQRKPFLLYLLKTYGFEILDSNIYKSSKHVIHICKQKESNTKYLLFENKLEQENFMKGKVAKEDNYQVVSKLSPNLSYLDSVILSQVYTMIDVYKANEKSTLVLTRNR